MNCSTKNSYPYYRLAPTSNTMLHISRSVQYSRGLTHVVGAISIGIFSFSVKIVRQFTLPNPRHNLFSSCMNLIVVWYIGDVPMVSKSIVVPLLVIVARENYCKAISKLSFREAGSGQELTRSLPILHKLSVRLIAALCLFFYIVKVFIKAIARIVSESVF